MVFIMSILVQCQIICVHVTIEYDDVQRNIYMKVPSFNSVKWGEKLVL